MDLSPTAYVILGFLSWRPMSGYDIKSVADESTRFFWAASYGQIYPELRRLADAGLIEAAEAAEGGRRRQEYALTAAGREVAGGLARARARRLRAPRRGPVEAVLRVGLARDRGGRPSSPSVPSTPRRSRRFREMEASGKPTGFALQTLRYGIEMQEWCDLLVRPRHRRP